MLVLILPEWNVNLRSAWLRFAYLRVLILPEWNVNTAKARWVLEFFSVLILQEWNVNIIFKVFNITTDKS